MERRATPTATQDRLRLLAEIARSLIEGSLEERLSAVIERAPGVLGVTSASIVLTSQEFAAFAERLTLSGLELKLAAPPDDSVVAQILASAEPLAIDNASHQPDVPAGIRSFLAVPLRSSAGCSGVLYFNHSRVRHFRGRERRLGAAIGNMVGQALENALLLEREREAREALETERRHLTQLAAALDRSVTEADLLRAVGSAATAAEGLHGLLRDVLELVRASVPFTAASIVALEGRQLVIVAVFGQAATRTLGRRTERREHLPIWRTIDLGEPIMREESRGTRAYSQGVRSMLQLPLRWKGQIYGALDVTSSQPHAFSVPDLNLMRKVADEIAGWVYLLLNRPSETRSAP